MSEHTPTVQEAFDPELRHDQADWDAYLQSRPFEDSQGNIHHPQTGQFIDADAYFDTQRQEIEAAGQAAYEDMSMPDLARKLAKAEHHGDKTMANDVHEVLLGKITKQYRETQSSRDVKHNANRMSNLVDRVMSIKDKELENLQGGPETEKDKGGTKVQYEPDENGDVRLGTELTASGDILDWANGAWTQGENRTIVIEDENGNKYYVKGNTVYDLAKSEKIGMPATWEIDGELENTELSNVVIGEGWQLAPDFKTDPVKKIQIGEGIAAKTHLGEHGAIDAEYKKRGRNPFQDAQEFLRMLEDQPTEVMTQPFDNERGGDTPDLDDFTTRKGLRTRARRLMGRASDVIKDWSLLALMKTQDGVNRLRDYYSDSEKGRRRRITGVIAGAVVLAGVGATVAYLELKGNSVMGTLQDGHGGAKGGGQNHELHEHLRKAVLHEGDNPWTASEHQLKAQGIAHPTAAQIEAYDKRMAHLNPNIYDYYGDSSEHIPAGTGLRLP